MDQQQLVSFLGWATLWNFVFLGFCAVLIVPFRETFSGWHARMFGIEASQVRVIYFQFLAFYEVLVLVFFAVPYLVLRFGV
jgi:hypothetical protein